jgi:2-iminobutanoate/2-iminopropanoate deaminase
MSLNLISTEKAPAAVGPYSQGVSTGNLIFTSGQLPIVPETGELITGDIQKAARQSLENVKAILAEAGATLEDVIKVTVFVSDMNNFSLINEVYAEFFSNHKPARSLVEVSKLPKNGEIEIEAIALKK